MLFETAANLCAAIVKQTIFWQFFSIFELAGITKHLITSPVGNSEFCFPSTSMFSSALPWETLRVSGEKKNALFHLGPVIKYLLPVSKLNYLRRVARGSSPSIFPVAGLTVIIGHLSNN